MVTNIQRKTCNSKKGNVVAIELTNKCNIKCQHCPNGRLEVPVGFMSRELFGESLKYCEDYTELNWRGESILHPDLLKFVKIAKEFNRQLNLGFHTNGLLMTKDLFLGLVDNGLNWLQISLHAPNSCFKYKEIISWNKRLKNPLYVYADVDNTQEELMALSCGLTPEMFHKDNIANWAGYLTDYRIVYDQPEKHAQECLFIRENKFIVAWDGSVNACCWDYSQCHKLGDIREFDTITHKPPYELCRYCIWVQK